MSAITSGPVDVPTDDEIREQELLTVAAKPEPMTETESARLTALLEWDLDGNRPESTDREFSALLKKRDAEYANK